MQTVFSGLSVSGGFDGYERGKGSFRVWFRRRVLWRVADVLRRRAAAPPLDDSVKGNMDALRAPDAQSGFVWEWAVRHDWAAIVPSSGRNGVM